MARQLVLGNQGRTHQLGAHQGNSRGRERIAYQDLPSIHEIENTLEQLTASITLKTEDIPRRPLTLWGSISYAVKAPDIPPIKTEDLERTTLGPTQAGGSEAENNMCMCVL